MLWCHQFLNRIHFSGTCIVVAIYTTSQRIFFNYKTSMKNCKGICKLRMFNKCSREF